MEDQNNCCQPPSPDAFADAHYKILAFTEGELTKRETAIKELHAALEEALDVCGWFRTLYMEVCMMDRNDELGDPDATRYLDAETIDIEVRGRAVLERHSPELPF